MKFTAVLFAGLAAAIPTNRVNGTAPDPSTYDNIDISSLNVRETLEGNTLKVTGIESVSFLLNTNVTCAADAPGTEGKVFPCGSTPYSFGLINGTTTQFGLRIYKATSQFGGRFGSGDIDTYCRSGGGSIEICQQVGGSATIVIAGQNGIHGSK